MAKKKTTKGGAGFGGTQNDDDESGVKETTMNDENFSLRRGHSGVGERCEPRVGRRVDFESWFR